MWKFPSSGALAVAGILLLGVGCEAPNAPAATHDVPAQDTTTFDPVIVPSTQGTPLVPKRFVPLTRIQEYLVVGTDFDGTGRNLAVVDPVDAFMRVSIKNAGYPDGTYFPPGLSKPTVPLLSSDTVAAGSPALRKVGKAAGLDDDFADEAVAVSWDPTLTSPGQLTLVDPDGAGAFPSKTVPSDLTVGSGGPPQYDLAAADLDADGYDEIAVVGALADASRSAGRLWIYDDAVHGFTLLSRTDLPGEPDVTLGHLGMSGVKVAAGVLDASRAARLVVGWTDTSHPGKVHYAVLDGRSGAGLRSGITDSLASTASFTNFNLRLANLDGDPYREIVIAGTCTGYREDYSVNAYFTTDYSRVWYQENRITVLDDLSAGGTTLINAATAPSWSPGTQTWWNRWGNYTPPGDPGYFWPENFVVPAGIGLDDVDSLVVGPAVYQINLAAGTFSKTADLDLGGGTYNTVVADVAAGDVTGDLREDVIVLFRTGKVEASGLLDNLVRMADGTLTMGTATWNKLDSRGGQATGYSNALLVPWNVDADSTLLEYNGNAADPVKKAGAHTTLYKDPKLIALLTAPPVKDGVGQNNGNSLTSLGTGSSQSFQSGVNFSVRTGVIVGFEAGISSGLFANVEVLRVEAELELQLEATGAYSQGVSVTKTVTDSAGPGEDQVVFATLPYDRYTYVVASHPVAALVGQSLTIDVPQKPKILSFTRNYFNTKTDGIKVTADLLPATPYQLSTYLKKAQIGPLLAPKTVEVGGGQTAASSCVLLGEMGPTPVTEGSGPGQSLQVDLSKNTTWSAGLQFNLDASATVIAAGVKVGTSFGYSVGGFCEASTGSTISFNGTVGSLPGAAYLPNYYEWGIFAYRQTLKDEAGKVMQNFLVVNYWIE